MMECHCSEKKHLCQCQLSPNMSTQLISNCANEYQIETEDVTGIRFAEHHTSKQEMLRAQQPCATYQGQIDYHDGRVPVMSDDMTGCRIAERLPGCQGMLRGQRPYTTDPPRMDCDDGHIPMTTGDSIEPAEHRSRWWRQDPSPSDHRGGAVPSERQSSSDTSSPGFGIASSGSLPSGREKPHLSKLKLSKLDRDKGRNHFQNLEDLLAIACGIQLKKLQQQNNGAKSGLQGDKDELLTIVYAILDVLTSIEWERARQSENQAEMLEAYQQIAYEARRGMSEHDPLLRLPSFSIIYGADQECCRYDHQQARNAGRPYDLSCTVHISEEDRLHSQTSDGSTDYRRCRLWHRQQNADRNRQTLGSSVRSTLAETWYRMQRTSSRTESDV